MKVSPSLFLKRLREARDDVRNGSRNMDPVLLNAPSMRSLQARLFLLLSAVLAFVALAFMGGCSATPDSAGGEGATLAGAQVDVGDDGDDSRSEDDGVGDVGDDSSDGPLTAVDDSVQLGSSVQALTTNQKMKATANLNLRKGAGTSFAVIAVIPSGTQVTLLSTVAKSGFLNIEFNGTAGWSSATYLTSAIPGGSTGGTSGGTVSLDGAASPDNAIARAKAAIGFSYYWGGGAWIGTGPTASTKGSCSGSCPSCSHSGKYGADCSGLVAKAWQFGTKALEVNSHPYSTVSFNSDSSGKWSTVSRGSLRKGDALVYNKNGAGHIVVYEKGDGWGSPTVIECRGCSYGCVYNARSFTSNYHGIRRAGF